MFEASELGHRLKKSVYNELEPELRLQLLEIQQNLRNAPYPVIVLFAGVDGAGKTETVNLLNSWMDPRWTETHAYNAPSEEERERPPFWRYWRDLPRKGKIGFFLSAWYSRPLLTRVYGEIDDAQFDQELERIKIFEKILSDDGAIIIKFWMHLGKKQQKRRLKGLEKDPLQSWRVTPRDWKHFKMYDCFASTAERMLMKTSVGEAPWTIVEGEDSHYREVKVAQTLRDTIKQRLIEAENRTQARKVTHKKKTKNESLQFEAIEERTILQSLDLSQTVEDKKSYRRILKEEQGRIASLFRRARHEGRSAILLFEGWDAAGKGGAIRRLTSALDARDYSVIPIAAPTDEESAQHYLWRFWRHLGRAGRATIFDRTWYGRVLVERIEGFATDKEWMRAYSEINHFEERLVDHGFILLKFWLHISKEEQLARFEAREKTPFKRWKLTDEDWRNREKWDHYEAAVNEMVARTSTHLAPWTLVEANDKRFARIKVLKTFADALEDALPKKKKKK